MEALINSITQALSQLEFVRAVVLGGSQAVGTATETSDVDIGIYYDHEGLDYPRLNAIAQALDDSRRKDLICREGGWGSWVNFGGWLTVSGYPVDLIFRDFERVQEVISHCEGGRFTANYHPGHPHAFLSVMYRGELAGAKLLYCRDEGFARLKKQAEEYPEKLRRELLNFFGFEARFSSDLASKNLHKGDLSYTAGHLFRGVSAMNQVLFALNKTYCLNEKKAIFRVDGFEKRPQNYSHRVNQIFSLLGEDSQESCRLLEILLGETEQFIQGEMN